MPGRAASAGPSLEQLFGLYAGELLGRRGICRAGDAGESQRSGGANPNNLSGCHRWQVVPRPESR